MSLFPRLNASWSLVSMKKRLDTAANGFALLELAIVMVVLGLLVGTGAGLLRSHIENKKRAETLEYMEEVRQSLLMYLKVHGNLPAADTDDDGRENRSTDYDGKVFGFLPYRDLGVRPVDAWGRVLKYAVNATMTYENQPSLVCETYFPRLLYAATYSTHPGFAPRVSDTYGGQAKMNVAAVIASPAARDADRDGDQFDALWTSVPWGSNKIASASSPHIPFLRATPRDTFDDIVLYIHYSTAYDWSTCSD